MSWGFGKRELSYLLCLRILYSASSLGVSPKSVGPIIARQPYLPEPEAHLIWMWQNFIASVSGAAASITVGAPLDVIKTRIQNTNFEHKVSGVTFVKDLLKREGPLALFKGLTPKVGRQAEPRFEILLICPSTCTHLHLALFFCKT